MSTRHVTWLHTNRRALWLGVATLLPLFAFAIGGVIVSTSSWLRGAAALLAAVLGYLLALCLYLMRQPRLSCAREQLFVRLRWGPPIRVPVELVECFFLGQGPTLLPRPFGDQDQVDETSTIVVRLAESAEAWKHFDVNPKLGLWCDGYITIRGTWCEPITNDLLRRLNDNLIAVHREQRGTRPAREQEVG